MHAQIVLFDGFDPMDVVGPYEVLHAGGLAGGVTSGLDLGLYLLERCLEPRISLEVEALFNYERRGTVWSAEGAEPVVTFAPDAA